VDVLTRPDKVETREAFVAYLEAMLTSLDQALANPRVPYANAVDDHGVEWSNTTQGTFLEAMDAWITAWGWTALDRAESTVWSAVVPTDTDFVGDEHELRRYLASIRDWAMSHALGDDEHWRPAAQALAAGRSE
jgi:hypothetical protein